MVERVSVNILPCDVALQYCLAALCPVALWLTERQQGCGEYGKDFQFTETFAFSHTKKTNNHRANF